MTGTLTVTSNGTPKPRPGSGSGGGSSSGGGSGSGGGGASGGGGTTAPKVGLSLGKVKLSTLRRSHKLRVKVTVSEPASLILTALIGKKAIATGRVTFASAGSKTVTLSLSRAGRRALRGKRSVSVQLKAAASHRIWLEGMNSRYSRIEHGPNCKGADVSAYIPDDF